MYTIIIAALFFGLVFGILFFISDKDWIYGIMTGVLGLFIGAFIGFIISLCLPSIIEKKLISTNQIEVLQDGQSVSGSFFLGCGSIDGEMKYTYYYQTEGGYKMNQLRYDRVLVKYDSVPRIETYRYFRTKNIKNKFSIWFANDDDYIIYVPKRTIKQNYTLDAK